MEVSGARKNQHNLSLKADVCASHVTPHKKISHEEITFVFVYSEVYMK
jgi:hypothetical protein